MAYGERLQRKNDKKADIERQGHSRNDLLKKEKQQLSERKLTFSITYDPVFRNVRGVMEELHILLTPNKEHKKVFPNVPVVGFLNGQSLKDYLVRAKLPKIDDSGRCKPCGKKNCLVGDGQKHAKKLLKFRKTP